MWLITETGFVSLVQDRKDPNKVWVRARVRGDIEKFLPEEYTSLVQVDAKADYAYRILVDKTVVAFQLYNQVCNIDYTSHAKEEMNKRSTPNSARMTAYYAVWGALERMQDIAPWSGKHTPGGYIGRFKPQTKAKTKATGAGVTSPGLFSSGEISRSASASSYDWDQHPQSATYRPTGFRNGKPVAYDTESAAWVDDAEWAAIDIPEDYPTPSRRKARRGRRFQGKRASNI